MANKRIDSGSTRRRVSRRNLRTGNVHRGNGSGGGRSFPRWLMALCALGAVGFIGIIVAAVGGIIVYRSYADGLVAPDELAINKPSYGAKIYDRNGALLYEYVDDTSGLRRPVKLEDVSPAFLAATIATEDDTFYSNPGVNIKGLLRAVWENFSPFSNEPGVLSGSGGSSITQQLVKNVYIPAADRQKRDPKRKIKEIVYSLELTQRYSKSQILDWYVNQISYGGVYNGVEAAAQGYFGKSAKDLTLDEATLLAGIPQSPAAYDPVNNPDAANARRNEVLDLMSKHDKIQVGDNQYYEINAQDVAAARDVPIDISTKRFPVEAPHFVLQYIQPQLERMYGHDALYTDGLVVTTTLDLNLQNEAQASMEKWISQYEDASNSHNGALMVMDPTSGEILVMLGSRDYFRDDIQGKNNNATACNSPGSSFKPFVYITSFLNLGWSPGTMILDTPVSYAQNDGTSFSPSNPDGKYEGPVTVRYALGNSLNVSADKTAAAVGPDNVVTEARKFGFMNTFRTTTQGGCSNGAGYGPAIATGGVGVTLEEMMIGYSVLADGGVMSGVATTDTTRRSNERTIDPVSILKVTDAQGTVRYDADKNRKQARVISPDYTYMIANILSDPSAQCTTFGCGGLSVPGYNAAVKTGTSEPFDQNGPNAVKYGETWAFAYTPDYVVGIWAGNSDNSPISNLFSTSIAYPTASDVLRETYAGRPQTPFARPSDIVSGTSCVPSGLKPTPLCGKTTTDLYIQSNLPSQDDTWWQKVAIDARNNLLAAPNTPPQFIEQRVLLQPPADLMKTDDDKKTMQDWASNLGVALAPTDVSTLGGLGGLGGGLPGLPGGGLTPGINVTPVPGGGGGLDLPVIIFTPQTGANLSGVAQITGRATSPRFSNYLLEYGATASPTSWQPIFGATKPVDNGTLGLWNTGSLAPGVYTIRLTVTDAQRGPTTATVVVYVNTNGTVTPVPGGTPGGPH